MQHIAKDDFEHMTTFPPPLPGCWDYKLVPPPPVNIIFGGDRETARGLKVLDALPRGSKFGKLSHGVAGRCL